ncbi:MAG: hypothetical protein CMJ40_05840 [Phycisphaerae bacterium]|nr:hypothetical protein [Phycisphaerae bacterium]
MSRSKVEFGSSVAIRHCPVGSVSVAVLAMVLLATAGSFGPSTIVRPVAGPQVLSVLALSVHHPAISGGDLEQDRPRGVETVRVVQPDLIRLEALRMGSQRLNLPPPRA